MTTSTERGVFESYLRVGVDVSPRLFFYSAQLYIYVDGVVCWCSIRLPLSPNNTTPNSNAILGISAKIVRISKTSLEGDLGVYTYALMLML